MLLNELSAIEYLEMVKEKKVCVEQVIKDIFSQIDKVEPTLKAYLFLNKEDSFAEAREMDRKIKDGLDIPPLAGLPIAIKDNICTQGIETTCASRILKGFVPPYDATIVKKIKDAGGIIIGKTNLDEFAMGSSTENSAFQTTLNPWDITFVPGGSSGGSGAAVAADEAIIALGTDTGGSVRLPASFCGISGIKPTYGRISRYGLVSYASSLDHVGILSKRVKDGALLMNIICGYDSFDSTSVELAVPDYRLSCREGISDLRFGVPSEFFSSEVHPDVKKKVNGAIEKISQLGGQVEETSLPHLKYALSAYYVTAFAEASSGLSRFDGVQYGLRMDDNDDLEDMYLKTRSKGFGTVAKQRIIMGTYTLSAENYEEYYLKAQRVRNLIKREFELAFKKYDLLIGPTSPILPFKVGAGKKDPMAMLLADTYTVPANLAGLPSLSLNCGFSEMENLPIGLQFIGRPFEEENVLRAAYNVEIALSEVTAARPNLSFSSTPNEGK